MKLAAIVPCAALTLMLLPQARILHARQKPEDLAQKSAETWLVRTDSGKYGESWDEASSAFKAAVSKEKWSGMLQSARTPLGALKSRKLSSVQYMKNPPSAPEGAYVILTYDASFEKLPSATETVSMALDKDGKWRAAGYFIKAAGM